MTKVDFSELFRIVFSNIDPFTLKDHALRQKETYTHASSCHYCSRIQDSFEVDDDFEDEADQYGPWGASPSKSFRRMGQEPGVGDLN